ncbi:hypothetical protein D1795_23935, partial [Salmonella enterica subsp. enterica serovar Freetown]|nr:hypothetical protein [Salmonella enterica subsp. enterica serovar Freetown]
FAYRVLQNAPVFFVCYQSFFEDKNILSEKKHYLYYSRFLLFCSLSDQLRLTPELIDANHACDEYVQYR